MNKQLAKQGSSMNKNMTNVESLVLTDIASTNASLMYLQSKSASFSRCDSSYIKTQAITCTALDIPTNLPTQVLSGTMYFNTTSHRLYISDGTHWYYITLTVV